MKDVRRKWIIGVGGSLMDDVRVFTFTGTKKQAKQKLLDMVNEDRREEEACNGEEWWSGTESVDEVDEQADDHLYAYACWDNYHIDYSATPVNKMYAA